MVDGNVVVLAVVVVVLLLMVVSVVFGGVGVGVRVGGVDDVGVVGVAFMVAEVFAASWGWWRRRYPFVFVPVLVFLLVMRWYSWWIRANAHQRTRGCFARVYDVRWRRRGGGSAVPSAFNRASLPVMQASLPVPFLLSYRRGWGGRRKRQTPPSERVESLTPPHPAGTYDTTAQPYYGRP